MRLTELTQLNWQAGILSHAQKETLSVSPSVHRSVYPFAHPSAHPSLHPFIRPSVHPSIHLYIRPSVCHSRLCLPLDPSVHLHIRPMVRPTVSSGRLVRSRDPPIIGIRALSLEQFRRNWRNERKTENYRPSFSFRR